jgi:hypothetical protein
VYSHCSIRLSSLTACYQHSAQLDSMRDDVMEVS